MKSMFEKKNVGPNYTTRMLLTDVKNNKTNEFITLKKFSHFTLSCTTEDESETIGHAISTLAETFKDAISFKVSEIINLGTKNSPLWGVKLDLGSKEEEIRKIFGGLFDKTMCPERNGKLYLWNATDIEENVNQKCPHVTLGPKLEDFDLAKKLVNLKCDFIFGSIDYKKVGPNDPHISINLSKEENLTSNFQNN